MFTSISSRSTRSLGESSRTSTTGTSFCTWRSTCSTFFERSRTTIVILEYSACSVGPTVRLAMLKPRREKRPAIRWSTPGLFSTRRLMVWVVPEGFSSISRMSLTIDHVVEGGACRDHREDLLLAADADVHDGRPGLVGQRLVDDLVQLLDGGRAQAEAAVRGRELHEGGPVRERRRGEPVVVEELLPLPDHPEEQVVQDEDLDRQLQVDRRR